MKICNKSSRSHIKSPSSDCLPINSSLEESNLRSTHWTRRTQRDQLAHQMRQERLYTEQVSPYWIGFPQFLKFHSFH